MESNEVSWLASGAALSFLLSAGAYLIVRGWISRRRPKPAEVRPPRGPEGDGPRRRR